LSLRLVDRVDQSARLDLRRDRVLEPLQALLGLSEPLLRRIVLAISWFRYGSAAKRGAERSLTL
jgi:hypothetical protein